MPNPKRKAPGFVEIMQNSKLAKQLRKDKNEMETRKAQEERTQKSENIFLVNLNSVLSPVSEKLTNPGLIKIITKSFS